MDFSVCGVQTNASQLQCAYESMAAASPDVGLDNEEAGASQEEAGASKEAAGASKEEAEALKLAMAAAASGSMDPAPWQQVLQHNCSNADALSVLADMARMQGRHLQASEYLERLLQVDVPEAGRTTSAGESRPRSKGEVLGALGHCFLAASHQEDGTPAILARLQQSYNAYHRALDGAQGEEQDPDLWYGIGLLYDRYASLMLPSAERLECEAAASQALDAVLRIEPKHERRDEVLFRLGLLFKAQHIRDRALECFSAISEDPPPPVNSLDVWFQIGHVHESVAPASALLAQQAYEQCLKLSAADGPIAKQARALRQLGWLCHSTGANAGAPPMLLLQQAVETDGSDAQSWHLLGKCLAQHGHVAPAYDALYQALARDDSSASAWATLGGLYATASKMADAVRAYRRSTALNPTVGEVWLERARACEALAITAAQQEPRQQRRRGGGSSDEMLADSGGGDAPPAAETDGAGGGGGGVGGGGDGATSAKGFAEEALAAYERARPLLPHRDAEIVGCSRMLQGRHLGTAATCIKEEGISVTATAISAPTASAASAASATAVSALAAASAAASAAAGPDPVEEVEGVVEGSALTEGAPMELEDEGR